MQSAYKTLTRTIMDAALKDGVADKAEALLMKIGPVIDANKCSPAVALVALAFLVRSMAEDIKAVSPVHQDIVRVIDALTLAVSIIASKLSRVEVKSDAAR